MSIVSSSFSTRRLLLRNTLLALGLWTTAVTGSWWWSYHTDQERIVELAKVEANTNINKDWSFRLWATSHGGVYVPPDENTPPNPYLAHIPDRDIVTDGGRRLTLMNPAYMLRQIMQQYTELYGVRGHITSLVLTNPANVADAWETAALKSFQAGAKEAVALTEIEGKPYLRIMRPIPMEKGCMKCHADTGIKAGEIRGGISTAIPLEPLYATSRPIFRNTNVVHGVVWLLGISAIGFIAWRSRRESEAIGIETLRAQRTQERMEIERAGYIEHLERSMEGTIQAIGLALEKRDPYTAGHQRRVSELAVAIARELGLGEDRIKGIKLGALIHDIGKIYVPAEILSRPGRLTATEFELVKSHCEIGHEIVEGVDFPWPVAQMILQHHERLDGSGYPGQLRGEAIMLEARILAVADVTEAMCSHRPYRPARGIELALDELLTMKGIRYDALAVDACVALFRSGRFGWRD